MGVTSMGVDVSSTFHAPEINVKVSLLFDKAPRETRFGPALSSVYRL
jgi:hypothetical protein